MASLIDKAVELTVGFILLVVLAGVIITQNATTLGSTLAWTIVGFITVAFAIGLMVKAFGIAKGSSYD